MAANTTTTPIAFTMIDKDIYEYYSYLSPLIGVMGFWGFGVLGDRKSVV